MANKAQNDEYSEYRKALAEGKTIQYNAHCHPHISGIWRRDKILDFHLPPENYRIQLTKKSQNKHHKLQIQGIQICYFI